MKQKVVWAIVLTFVIIVAFNSFQYLFKLKSIREEPQIRKVEKELCISVGGDSYLRTVEESMKIGRQLKELSLTNSFGERVNLSGKKSLLTFGIPGCGSCKTYYPILKDWAMQYKKNLRIIVIFENEPKDSEIEELEEAGFQVVVGLGDLQGIVEKGQQLYSYLIDEEGKIIYRYQFDVFKWVKISSLVNKFVNEELDITNLVKPVVSYGKPLLIPVTKDVLGSEFNLSKFKGKPVLLFLVSPGCFTCEQAYSYIRELHGKYQNKVKIITVLYYYDKETADAVHKYYTKYNLQTYGETKSNENPDSLIKENKLENITVYFDNTYEIFDYFSVTITPTMVILDRQLNLIDIVGLSTC